MSQHDAKRTHRSLPTTFLSSVQCLALIVGLICPLPATSQGPGSITLRQTHVYVLPDSLEITGLTMSDDGDLLAWSMRTGHVLHLHGGDWRVVGSGNVKQPIAGSFTGSGSMEIVDGGLNEVFSFDTHDALVGRTIIDPSVTIGAAAWKPEGWYVVADWGREPAVYRVQSDGSLQPFARLPEWGHRDPDSTWVELSPDRDGLLVSYESPPFEAFRILGKDVFNSFATPEVLHGDQSASQEPVAKWVAFPVLAVATGYVRSFADLKSDQRLIAVYDTNRNLIREKPLDLPIGLHASIPSQSALVGVTRLEQLEIRVLELALEPPAGRRER